MQEAGFHLGSPAGRNGRTLGGRARKVGAFPPVAFFRRAMGDHEPGPSVFSSPEYEQRGRHPRSGVSDERVPRRPIAESREPERNPPGNHDWRRKMPIPPCGTRSPFGRRILMYRPLSGDQPSPSASSLPYRPLNLQEHGIWAASARGLMHQHYELRRGFEGSVLLRIQTLAQGEDIDTRARLTERDS